MPTGEKLTQVFAEYVHLPEAGAGKSARDGCRDGSGGVGSRNMQLPKNSWNLLPQKHRYSCAANVRAAGERSL